jgi:hypothetical protein
MIVIIESPFAGARNENILYARRAMLDSLRRGEAPFASHLLYPQVLDDDTPADRELGILAGFNFYSVAALCAVYADMGVSPGMLRGIAHARAASIPVTHRMIGYGQSNKD